MNGLMLKAGLSFISIVVESASDYLQGYPNNCTLHVKVYFWRGCLSLNTHFIILDTIGCSPTPWPSKFLMYHFAHLLTLGSHFQCTKQLIYFLGFNLQCMSSMYTIIDTPNPCRRAKTGFRILVKTHGAQRGSNWKRSWETSCELGELSWQANLQASLSFSRSGFLPSWSVVFEQTRIALTDLSRVSDHDFLSVLVY